MKRGKILTRFFIFLVVTTLLFMSPTEASGLESHDITYDIQKDHVKTTHILQFNEELKEKEFFTIPRDAENLVITSPTGSVDVDFDEGMIELPEGYNEFTIAYDTKEILHTSNTRNVFTTTIETLYPTKTLKISAELPKRSALTAPVTDGRAVFPPPINTSTDGQRITLNWESLGLDPGEPTGVFLTYNLGTDFRFLWLGIIGFIVAVVGVYVGYKSRKRKKEIKEEKVEEKPKTDDTDFEEHLKEEERHIVNVLRQKEGKCQQSTLVVLTGYSKAHLSRILQEMEARKLVVKAVKGNKNVIILNEKLKDLEEI